MSFDRKNNRQASKCWTCSELWNCCWLLEMKFPDGAIVESEPTLDGKFKTLDRIVSCPNYKKEIMTPFAEDEKPAREYKKIKSRGKCKPVAMLDKNTGEVIKIHPSILEAAEAMKATRSNISSALRGASKTAVGYVWKYADKLEETN